MTENIVNNSVFCFTATIPIELYKNVSTYDITLIDIHTTFFPFKTLLLAVCSCCCGLPNNTRSYNILVFLPTETKSHFIGFRPLLETLVTRGHNVTLVSPFALGSDGTPLPHYTHVKVDITENVAGSCT